MSNTDKPKQTFKQMMTAECRMMRDRLKETGIIDWAVHKEVVRQWINENCIPKSEVENMIEEAVIYGSRFGSFTEKHIGMVAKEYRELKFKLLNKE